MDKMREKKEIPPFPINKIGWICGNSTNFFMK